MKSLAEIISHNFPVDRIKEVADFFQDCIEKEEEIAAMTTVDNLSKDAIEKTMMFNAAHRMVHLIRAAAD